MILIQTLVKSIFEWTMSYWGCTLSFIIPFSQFVLKAPLLWILFDIVLVKFLPGIYSHRFYFPSRAFFCIFSFSNQSIFFSFRRELQRVTWNTKSIWTQLKFLKHSLTSIIWRTIWSPIFLCQTFYFLIPSVCTCWKNKYILFCTFCQQMFILYFFSVLCLLSIFPLPCNLSENFF